MRQGLQCKMQRLSLQNQPTPYLTLLQKSYEVFLKCIIKTSNVNKYNICNIKLWQYYNKEITNLLLSRHSIKLPMQTKRRSLNSMILLFEQRGQLHWPSLYQFRHLVHYIEPLNLMHVALYEIFQKVKTYRGGTDILLLRERIPEQGPKASI